MDGAASSIDSAYNRPHPWIAYTIGGRERISLDRTRRGNSLVLSSFELLAYIFGNFSSGRYLNTCTSTVIDGESQLLRIMDLHINKFKQIRE